MSAHELYGLATIVPLVAVWWAIDPTGPAVTLAAYRQALGELELAERRVKRYADAKACAVLDMARGGMSVTQIAQALELTRARVSQLLARARALPDSTELEHAAPSGVLVTDAMLADARKRVLELRAEVRRQAGDARTESLRILEGADAVKVTRPTDRSIGEWDWTRGLDPHELERLRGWWSDSRASTVDNVAEQLRMALPALVNLGDDEIMARAWLYHTRIVDAGGAIARGKFPSPRRYSGRVNVDQLAPGVAADGYDVALIMGDDDAAARHVATVDATRDADDAYRMLGDTATCVHGPAPWRMSADAYTAELLALEAQLRGHDELERSEQDTRARHDELVPKLLDDGCDYPTLHARIVDTARTAGLS